MTTGGFTSEQLALEEQILVLPHLDIKDAVEIGEIGAAIARRENLPISIRVQMGEWIVFHIAMPAAEESQTSWITRKARVVLATGHSTIFERVQAEEQGRDWYADHNTTEEIFAIHGGGVPLNVSGVSGIGLKGILLISGLPQVEDHLLCVRIITEFLARVGENQ